MNKQEILEKQKQYLWPNHLLYYTEPLPLDHGEGMYVWDVNGNKYLDFFAGILVTSVGHNHPKVTERVQAQAAKLLHTSTLYPNENQVALAEKMAEITPGKLQTSYFTASGTEANEAAVILAKVHTGYQEVIALRHGYSGRSALAMGLAGLVGLAHCGHPLYWHQTRPESLLLSMPAEDEISRVWGGLC